jgi:hypothetical protein
MQILVWHTRTLQLLKYKSKKNIIDQDFILNRRIKIMNQYNLTK